MNSKKGRSRISPNFDQFKMERHELTSNVDGQSVEFSSEKNVVIQTGTPSKTSRDSCRVQSQTLSEYKWDCRLYEGNLVAVHHRMQYVAYVLHNRNGSVVRVYNRTSKTRQLIKGFKGECVDLGWSHDPENPLLACIDQSGNIFIYVVVESGHEDGEPSFTVQKHLVISRDDETNSNEASMMNTDNNNGYRLIWCPYIPEPTSSTKDQDQPSIDSSIPESAFAMATSAIDHAAPDVMHLLAVIKDCRVELIIVGAIRLHFDSENVRFDKLNEAVGSFAIVVEQSQVRNAVMSPDATALAVGCVDGTVRFYILENFEEVRCAHSWQPHKGKPLDSIVFLDDLKDKAQDQFWKFALTASDGHRELRLWNCESWKCIGQLRVEPPLSSQDGYELRLYVDTSARFVFLSDLDRSALYCIELAQDGTGELLFVSFNDFSLCLPLLDLAIFRVQRNNRTCSPIDLGVASDGSVDGENGAIGVIAELIAINQRSLLELQVRFDSLSLKSTKNDISPGLGDLSSINPENAIVATTTKFRKKSSPDSQEVCNIFEHASNDEDEDEDDDDLEMDEEDEVSAMNRTRERRPDTPVARTLAVGDDEDHWAPITQISSDDSSVTVPKLVDAVNRMSMELERLSSWSGRPKQVDELSIRRIVDEQRRLVDHSRQQFDDARLDREKLVIEALNRLETELTKRADDNDQMLKEHFTKLAKSKSVTDVFGRSISEAIKEQTMVAFNEQIRLHLTPSYETMNRKLYEQLNKLFYDGTRNYMNQMDKLTNSQHQLDEQWHKQLNRAIDQLSDQLEKHIESMSVNLRKHADETAARLQESIDTTVRSTVRDELARFLSENPHQLDDQLLRLQASTPLSTVGGVADRQLLYRDLLHRLQSRDFDGAFECVTCMYGNADTGNVVIQALSVCDLSAVMFVCSKVDPKQLFAREPCPLKQPVVLSLLQQITTDLSTRHTSLKLNYIEEALMSIDVKNLEVAPHLPAILKLVHDVLLALTQSQPMSPHFRQAKKTLLAIKSLVVQ